MQRIEPCVQLGRVMATLAIDLVRFVCSTLLAIGAIGGSRSRPIRERTRSAAAALPAAFLYAVARGVDSLCGFQALYHDSPSLLSSPLAFGTVLGALVFISPIFLNAVGRSRA
jgi:hypothetical protein